MLKKTYLITLSVLFLIISNSYGAKKELSAEAKQKIQQEFKAFHTENASMQAKLDEEIYGLQLGFLKENYDRKVEFNKKMSDIIIDGASADRDKRRELKKSVREKKRAFRKEQKERKQKFFKETIKAKRKDFREQMKTRRKEFRNKMKQMRQEFKKKG